MMRNMKADVMRNATKQTKKNYFIVFDWGGGVQLYFCLSIL